MISKAEIKLIRSLADKTARAESGLFAVEGDKMVSEALASGLGVERVFVTSKSGLPGQAGIRTLEPVSDKDMERISHLRTPSSSLALMRIPKYEFSVEMLRGGLTLALDGVQDPGNLGTIIRIADWFGIRDILCSATTADWLNPKVVQATMGALFRVRIHYVNLAEALTEAAGMGTEIYGTFLEGENIYEAVFAGEQRDTAFAGQQRNTALADKLCNAASADKQDRTTLAGEPIKTSTIIDPGPEPGLISDPGAGSGTGIVSGTGFGVGSETGATSTSISGPTIVSPQASTPLSSSVSSIIVMGNEGRGISPAVECTVSRKLFIPPYPPQRQGSESLNVAVATAIICSEYRRRAIQ